ncbi:uncharacterized protein PSFLO_06920 [Pseudozyma flocculosa]|uniref:Uncharacterized protein n=1 Tax=Pseudozyma flocculosa TaxID=84751 RepID=A0A5C3FAE8_9BASI|nr:uncharacterized protein PSFLO_06920 [Pseudozyma flocculosa]
MTSCDAHFDNCAMRLGCGIWVEWRARSSSRRGHMYSSCLAAEQKRALALQQSGGQRAGDLPQVLCSWRYGAISIVKGYLRLRPTTFVHGTGRRSSEDAPDAPGPLLFDDRRIRSEPEVRGKRSYTGSAFHETGQHTRVSRQRTMQVPAGHASRCASLFPGDRQAGKTGSLLGTQF